MHISNLIKFINYKCRNGVHRTACVYINLFTFYKYKKILVGMSIVNAKFN